MLSARNLTTLCSIITSVIFLRLTTSFSIPDMTTYKAMRMAFDSLLYPYRDPEKMF